VAIVKPPSKTTPVCHAPSDELGRGAADATTERLGDLAIGHGMSWGVGVSGDMPTDEIVDMAVLSDEMGYRSFWVNVPRIGMDPVALMNAIAGRTTSLDVGVGVVPLDAYPPERLAQQAKSAGLNDRRFIIGVGCGRASAGQLALVRAGIDALRGAVPAARIAISAVGPKMFSLGANAADAIVTSMMQPERARQTERDVTRPPGHSVYLYHRVAEGVRGTNLLRQEMLAMGAWTNPRDASRRKPLGTALGSGGDLIEDLRRYPMDWTPVLRPLFDAEATLTDRLRVIRRVAPIQ
jgi:hypothetical protein